MTVKELIDELLRQPLSNVVEIWHDASSENGVTSQNIDVLGSDGEKVVLRIRDISSDRDTRETMYQYFIVEKRHSGSAREYRTQAKNLDELVRKIKTNENSVKHHPAWNKLVSIEIFPLQPKVWEWDGK